MSGSLIGRNAPQLHENMSKYMILAGNTRMKTPICQPLGTSSESHSSKSRAFHKFLQMVYQSHKENIGILIVIDRFSKYAHFLSSIHPYSTTQIIKLLSNNIFKIHSLKESNICNFDPTFTSLLQESFLLCNNSSLVPPTTNK